MSKLRINAALLAKIMPEFVSWLDGPEGVEWRKQRRDKDKFFGTHFSRERLPELQEGTLREMIYILWAFNGWTNKDYLFQRMMASGLPTIREAFEYLLYSGDGIAKRFDRMRKVWMMGAASISEILAHHDNNRYPIWNSRSKEGLATVAGAQFLKATQITGAKYEKFCGLAQEVLAKVRGKYPEIKDLFELDFLLYYVSTKKDSPLELQNGRQTRWITDHDAIIEQVLQLGDGLGFEVEKEFSVTQGCRIDAIWRSRIGNLGTVKYAFEVHNRGSRDSAILNLQRVRKDNSIQKVVIVSTEEELKIFQREIVLLDESFRNAVGYLTVDDLQRALDHIQSMKNLLSSLGLLSVRPPQP